MTESTSRRTSSHRAFAASALIWILLLAGSVYFAEDLEERLWILSAFWWLGLWAAGAVLATWGLVPLARRPRRPAVAAGLLFVTVAAVGVQSQEGTLRTLRLGVKLRRYHGVVAQIQASRPGAGPQNVNGVGCHVEPGPPLRVAFPQPGGLLDNYRAVVYDPTGLVMQSNVAAGSGDPGRVSPRVRALFGGDLVCAEPLGGPWYLRLYVAGYER